MSILNVNFGGSYINPANIINVDFNYDSKFQINGIVMYDDIISANNIVRLYNRATGSLIKETLSDANGEYVFENLTSNDLVYIVCLDKNTPIQYNALINDRIIPQRGI